MRPDGGDHLVYGIGERQGVEELPADQRAPNTPNDYISKGSLRHQLQAL